MAGLILPRRFTSQPQGAVELDHNNDITKALDFVALGNSRFSGKSWATDTGTVSSVAGAQGIASQAASTSATRRTWAETPILNIGNDYSIVLLANPAAGTGVISRAAYIGAEAAGDYTGIGVAFNATRSYAYSSGRVASIEYSGTTRRAVDSTADAVDGGWHLYVITPNGKIYVDGVDKTNSASGTAASVAMTAGVHLHGQPTSTANGYTSGFALTGIYNRILSQSEARELSRNPWQLFRAKKRVLYFDVGAGGTTPITASDTLTPSLTEVQASLVSSSVTETLAPSLTEVAALFKNPEFITVTETLSVSVTEAIALLASSTLTDTLTPSLTESASLNTGAFEVAVTDGLTPSLTEAQTSLVSSAITEALTLTLGEVQGSLLSSSITDTFAISVSEAVTLLVANTVTDTLVVSITDTSGVVTADVTAKEVSDALTPYFTELGALEYLDAWQMESLVVGVWTSSSANTGNWTEESSAAGTWSEESPL